jgi:O-antigen ligase
LLILIWLIWELAFTEQRVTGLLNFYIAGTCVSSVSMFRNFITGRTVGQIGYEEGAWTDRTIDSDRYTVEGFNANDLGLLFAMSIPITIYLISRRKGGAVTYLYWLQLVAAITVILLTGSRTAVLALTASMMMLPFAIPQWPKSQKVVSLLVCAGIIVSAILVVPAETWDRLLTIKAEVTSGTLDRRTVIWSAGLEIFDEHPLVGVGSGSFPDLVVKRLDRAAVAHNTFLSILVELGVIGFMIFSMLLLSMFYCALRTKGLRKYLWITLLVTWMIGVSAATWEYSKLTWLLFGLLAADIGVVSPGRSTEAQGRFTVLVRRQISGTRADLNCWDSSTMT